VRGKHNKLGEGERKVRLGQDSLPNIVISVAETSGNYIRCFTRTQIKIAENSNEHKWSSSDTDYLRIDINFCIHNLRFWARCAEPQHSRHFNCKGLQNWCQCYKDFHPLLMVGQNIIRELVHESILVFYLLINMTSTWAYVIELCWFVIYEFL